MKLWQGNRHLVWKCIIILRYRQSNQSIQDNDNFPIIKGATIAAVEILWNTIAIAYQMAQ